MIPTSRLLGHPSQEKDETSPQPSVISCKVGRIPTCLPATAPLVWIKSKTQNTSFWRTCPSITEFAGEFRFLGQWYWKEEYVGRGVCRQDVGVWSHIKSHHYHAGVVCLCLSFFSVAQFLSPFSYQGYTARQPPSPKKLGRTLLRIYRFQRPPFPP